MPSDEIHIGDKGGGSFKMNFQIVNQVHPSVFCAFEAPDNTEDCVGEADKLVGRQELEDSK